MGLNFCLKTVKGEKGLFGGEVIDDLLHCVRVNTVATPQPMKKRQSTVPVDLPAVPVVPLAKEQ